MSKTAEQNYLKLTGESGRNHSLLKPFSDAGCGSNLASIGTIMVLLPEPPGRILDMGCGGGWTSVFLAKRGYEVVGQDISEDMIDLARENAERQGVADRTTFVCEDYEDAAVEQQFDAVLFYDCLHHSDDERAALASAYRALKRGGMCITHEPGEGHAEAPNSIEAMQLYGVCERDMPPHLIIKHAKDIGFSGHRIYPMQDMILELFYRHPVPRKYSKARRSRARKILELAFNPSERAGGLVVLVE